MELRYRPKKAIAGRAGLLAVLILAAGSAGLHGRQTVPSFYDVDKEVRVEGQVAEVRMEPRYKDRAPFLVVVLTEKSTRKAYTVEVSPVWFFEFDLHRGEALQVIGSASESGASPGIMAREIQCRGETITVRDKNGFPRWSGGRGAVRRKRGAGA